MGVQGRHDAHGGTLRTLIRAAYIIAHDEVSHRSLKDGVIVWEDDRVVYVGHAYLDPRRSVN